MIRRRLACAALAWMVGAAGLGAAALAGSIQVTPVVAEGQVSASFSAPSSFGDDMRQAVRSGLLVTFTFSVELRRPSTVWLDHTVGQSTVASAVKFDNLTGVYQVSKLQDGHVTWSERTQEDAKVRMWMTKFDRVALAPRVPLEPNGEYYVRVRMQATPKLNFSFWPWASDAASGRADFTFIR